MLSCAYMLDSAPSRACRWWPDSAARQICVGSRLRPMTAPGDFAGAVSTLSTLLARVGYPHAIWLRQLRDAEPIAILTIAVHALHDYSRHVALHTMAAGVHLSPPTAASLPTLAHDLARASWHVGVPLCCSPAQLVTPSFAAERKVSWLISLLRWAIATHEEGERAAALAHPPVAPYSRCVPTPVAAPVVVATCERQSLSWRQRRSHLLGLPSHCDRRTYPLGPPASASTRHHVGTSAYIAPDHAAAGVGHDDPRAADARSVVRPAAEVTAAFPATLRAAPPAPHPASRAGDGGTTQAASLVGPAVRPYPAGAEAGSHAAYSGPAVMAGDAVAAWAFLNDAVAVGTGASNSLLARKRQAWYESAVAAPAAARSWDVTPAYDALVTAGLALPQLAAQPDDAARSRPGDLPSAVPVIDVMRISNPSAMSLGEPPAMVMAPAAVLRAHATALQQHRASEAAEPTRTAPPQSRLPVRRQYLEAAVSGSSSGDGASAAASPRRPRARFTALAWHPAVAGARDGPATAFWVGTGDSGLARAHFHVPLLAPPAGAGPPRSGSAAPATGAARRSAGAGVSEHELSGHSALHYPTAATTAAAAPVADASSTDGDGNPQQLASADAVSVRSAAAAAAAGVATLVEEVTTHVLAQLATMSDRLAAVERTAAPARRPEPTPSTAAQAQVAASNQAPARPAAADSAAPQLAREPTRFADSLAAYLSVMPVHRTTATATSPWSGTLSAGRPSAAGAARAADSDDDDAAGGDDAYAAAVARVRAKSAAAAVARAVGGSVDAARSAPPGSAPPASVSTTHLPPPPHANMPVDAFLAAMAARAAGTETLISRAAVALAGPGAPASR